MQKPRINAIVALNKNRAIGRDNDLIYKIPDDLKRFKTLTTGHPVIMGRKTFESIGRPLPNRTNIIITRNPSYSIEGTTVVTSLEKAIQKAKEIEHEEIFILGGGEIYTQALPTTDRLYITLVDSDEKGDTFFPEYKDFTKIISQEKKDWNGLHYEWLTLER